jgi:hypothetical protein
MASVGALVIIATYPSMLVHISAPQQEMAALASHDQRGEPRTLV